MFTTLGALRMPGVWLKHLRVVQGSCFWYDFRVFLFLRTIVLSSTTDSVRFVELSRCLVFHDDALQQFALLRRLTTRRVPLSFFNLIRFTLTEQTLCTLSVSLTLPLISVFCDFHSACDMTRLWQTSADVVDTGSRLESSRCLEHDGQLFSIQLVPAVSSDKTSVPVSRVPPTPTPTATSSPISGAASSACDLENHSLDFCPSGLITPLQRWFGLKWYVLVRALRQNGVAGIGIDQLLWATTVATSNCKCSIPVLVSCDWDGLDCEEEDKGGVMKGGAACKGYSAPGCKGVACSVRFQSAVTEKVREVGRGREGCGGGKEGARAGRKILTR